MMHSCDTSNGTYAARSGNAVTGYTTRALSRRSHDKNLTIQGENEFLHHTLASEQADPLLDWDRRPGSLVHAPQRPLLRAYDNKITPSVFLPTRLVVVSADRLFLAVAEQGYPGGGNAQVREILLRICGAPLAKRHIVLLCSPFVTVPLDPYLVSRVCLQPISIRFHDRSGISTDGGSVIIEINRLKTAPSGQ